MTKLTFLWLWVCQHKADWRQNDSVIIVFISYIHTIQVKAQMENIPIANVNRHYTEEKEQLGWAMSYWWFQLPWILNFLYHRIAVVISWMSFSLKYPSSRFSIWWKKKDTFFPSKKYEGAVSIQVREGLLLSFYSSWCLFSPPFFAFGCESIILAKCDNNGPEWCYKTKKFQF